MATTQQPGAAPDFGNRRGEPLPPPPNRLTQRVQSSTVGKWVATGVTAATCAGLAGYLFLVDPNIASNPYPQCPLEQLTGIDCPGCGGLRATHSMVHGDIAGAISHNVLALIVVPLIAYLIVRWVLGLWGKDLPQIRLPRWTQWAIPLAVLAFTVVRNIPSTPLYYFNSAA